MSIITAKRTATLQAAANKPPPTPEELQKQEERELSQRLEALKNERDINRCIQQINEIVTFSRERPERTTSAVLSALQYVWEFRSTTEVCAHAIDAFGDAALNAPHAMTQRLINGLARVTVRRDRGDMAKQSRTTFGKLIDPFIEFVDTRLANTEGKRCSWDPYVILVAIGTLNSRRDHMQQIVNTETLKNMYLRASAGDDPALKAEMKSIYYRTLRRHWKLATSSLVESAAIDAAINPDKTQRDEAREAYAQLAADTNYATQELVDKLEEFADTAEKLENITAAEDLIDLTLSIRKDLTTKRTKRQNLKRTVRKQLKMLL